MEPPLFTERYQDDRVRFTVTLTESLDFTVAFVGRGTNEGTRAFVEMMDRCVAIARARGQRISGLVDLTHLDGAPLRSQATLTRWLLGARADVARLAIAGGGRFEQGLARAITSAAGLDTVKLLPTTAEARAWLAR